VLSLVSSELARQSSVIKRGGQTAQALRQLRVAFATLGAQAQTQLEAKLLFAERIGMPVLPLLDAVAHHLRFESEIRAQINKTLAATRFTVNLITWLPWLSLLAAQFLGLSALTVLFQTPLGWTICAVSAVLGWFSRRWHLRLVYDAGRIPSDPGAWLELAAVGIGAGTTANAVMQELQLVSDESSATLVWAHVSDCLDRGGPMVAYLQEGASRRRQEQVTAKGIELARLPQKMLLPIGALSLPQFALLLVVPTLVSAAQAAFK